MECLGLIQLATSLRFRQFTEDVRTTTNSLWTELFLIGSERSIKICGTIRSLTFMTLFLSTLFDPLRTMVFSQVLLTWSQ